MNREKKTILTGYEDFKKIIDLNGYFVDKTLLIQEILETGAETTLLTRPRRFGKTLNLSILRRFFEDERTSQGEKIDNSYLFNGLAVTQCGEEILRHQQQYPAISLSLKSAKQPDYEMAYDSLKEEIEKEFSRHIYVLDSDCLSEIQKKRFQNLINRKADKIEYAKALAFLSECLAKYHRKNVMILIDEYDVPLENAYFKKFYNPMTDFIRSLFESALKTNPYLERGIITGCLRISKESIFTGLNNLEIHSILSSYYSDKFGFTEKEVQEFLTYYGLSDQYPEIKRWYDGYQFGEVEIYNPWSILNHVKQVRKSKAVIPKAYWSNTSSNSIVRELIETSDDETREDLEILMAGGTIEKPMHEEIIYGDIHGSKDNLWSFLFFTGYLKAERQRAEDDETYVELSIPNKEIKSVYRRSIVHWFDQKVKQIDLRPVIKALEGGDCETVQRFLAEQLMETISYLDYAENFYHAFLAGLLKSAGGYRILSNRESGTGRPDLLMKTRYIRNGKVMILEVKVADKFQNMEKCCEEGLKQIEERNYEAEVRKEGYENIRKYAICFFQKECIMMEG